jgi:hypothetical protein
MGGPTWAVASIKDDLAFETSAFMKKRVYQNPKRTAADVAPDGAYGPVNIAWDKSHAGNWYVELQHTGFNAIAAGIAQNDTEAIERGLRILEWGFQQQRSDGSFNCPDNFHSTSFFLEAAAHSCLLLQVSQFAERYRRHIDWMKPRIALTARWMTRPEVEGPGLQHNKHLAHRFYLVAAALGESGVLLGDETLVNHSKEYIRMGVAVQDPSGFNPEGPGYDTSYHGIGMYFALVYYTVVADPKTQAEMFPMLKKGMLWLKSRILPDGSINGEGNTRTGPNAELSRSGKQKALDYLDVFRSFAYFGQITGDNSWLELADKVAEASRHAH